MTQPARRAIEQLKAAAAAVCQSADRRTILAADRTIFAAERTYAAWVRTGAGVGAKAALGQVMSKSVVLAMLAVFSAFCFAAAVWRELSPAPPPQPDMRRFPPALLIGITGFLILVALIALWASGPRARRAPDAAMGKRDAQQVADLLLEIGKRATLEGGNPHKARAYMRAADTCGSLG